MQRYKATTKCCACKMIIYAEMLEVKNYKTIMKEDIKKKRTHSANNRIINSGVLGSDRNGGLNTWAAA